jgi:hypothetical protein
MKEQGIDFSLGTIRGLAVPREVPPDRIRTLAEAVERVARSEEYLATMSSAGFTPAYEEPAQLARTLEQTDIRLGALLRSPAFEGLTAKQVGPMFFPGLLFTALAGVVLGLLVISRRGAPDPVAAAPAGASWRIVEPLLGIGLYITFAERAGFMLTAGTLLLVYLVRLGTRLQVALPLTLVLVPATYYVFAGLLRVALPRGILGW